MPIHRPVSPEDELEVLRRMDRRINVSLAIAHPEIACGMERALALEDGNPCPPLTAGTYTVRRRHPIVFTLTE